MTEVTSANSGHCSAIPSTVSALWEPAASCVDVTGAAPATVLPTPRTFSAAEPSIGMDMTLEHGPSLDRGKTPACRTLGSLPRHATPEGRYPPQQPPRRLQEPQGRRRDLRKAKDAAQESCTPSAMISSTTQCTSYSRRSLCAPDSGKNDDFSPLPYMYTAPPYAYKRRRRAPSQTI